MPAMTNDDISRFLSKVRIGGRNECWPWTAGTYHFGHGQFKVNGKSYKSSRIAYFLTTGIDPGSLNVLHSCDNPPCCNPRHLFPGTLDANNKDRAAKGRSVVGYCDRRGTKNGRSKLTPRRVRAIRRSRKPNVELAVIHKISDQMVSRIKSRQAWKHVA